LVQEAVSAVLKGNVAGFHGLTLMAGVSASAWLLI